MNPKTSLAIALPALLAASLLLPAAAADLDAAVLAPGLLDSVLVVVTYYDGQAHVEGAAAEVDCVQQDAEAADVLCIVDLIGSASHCTGVGVDVHVVAGSGGATSACKGLSASCSVFLTGDCSSASYGSGSLPWTCTLRGVGVYAVSCWVTFTSQSE